jgi:Zn finger protein HypA/HybF involved in hydrogenase expression
MLCGLLALALPPSPLCLTLGRSWPGRVLVWFGRHADHYRHDLGCDIVGWSFAHEPILARRDGQLQPSRLPLSLSARFYRRSESFMAVDLLAGLGVFKSLYDSAKALKDINDATIRNGAIIELQEKILAAREAQAALLERVGELEKEMANFKTWEAEKQKYEMKVLSPGAIVYAFKAQIQGAEPSHYICAHCYEDGKKSLLQIKRAEKLAAMHFGTKDRYVCPRCHAEVAP